MVRRRGRRRQRPGARASTPKRQLSWFRRETRIVWLRGRRRAGERPERSSRSGAGSAAAVARLEASALSRRRRGSAGRSTGATQPWARPPPARSLDRRGGVVALCPRCRQRRPVGRRSSPAGAHVPGPRAGSYLPPACSIPSPMTSAPVRPRKGDDRARPPPPKGASGAARWTRLRSTLRMSKRSSARRRRPALPAPRSSAARRMPARRQVSELGPHAFDVADLLRARSAPARSGRGEHRGGRGCSSSAAAAELRRLDGPRARD